MKMTLYSFHCGPKYLKCVSFLLTLWAKILEMCLIFAYTVGQNTVKMVNAVMTMREVTKA